MASSFIQSAPGYFVDPSYLPILAESGIDSLDAVFDFDQGKSLHKANLAAWRHRIRFQLSNGQTGYLKRYDAPPLSVQVKGWLQHARHGFLSEYDKGPLEALKNVEVAIPQTIAYGGQWSGLFEKRSFIITLEIPHAHSLETQLPNCFTDGSSEDRRNFIVTLADFIRRFHNTGYRHRDLYLCHIFYADNGDLYLIDLHRTFKPKLSGRRYRLKDLAQLFYSSPGDQVYRTDRLRFYLAYNQKRKLSPADKSFIQKIIAKARKMAHHDRKQGRRIPFEKRSDVG